jgi:hypothetical protein
VVTRAAVAVVMCGAAACTPTFSDETTIVSAPRLLAVQAVPAEAALGDGFTMTALYVGPTGPADPSGLNWAICVLPKPLGQPGPINPDCFVDVSAGLTPLGAGGSVEGTVPEDACQLFGPDSPPPQPGQPSARPTDPDSTGGFYLPVRIGTGDGQWAAAPERIACAPSGLTQQVFTAFSSGYHVNENPSVTSLSAVGADGGATPIAPDSPGVASAFAVSAGEHVSLRVEWPSCPPTTTPCAGAETYLYIDPTTKQISTQRESMVASWYATAGAFDVDRAGRADNDPTPSVDNGWTAPPSSGLVHVWLVLRDSRGGVGWESYTIKVP